ncbi:hypothetical protein ON010_g9485 [Phytophthora cinnamomi]|nr:hypothetical protein ON010_g9485 [Phytophthora cinnamomi]
MGLSENVIHYIIRYGAMSIFTPQSLPRLEPSTGTATKASHVFPTSILFLYLLLTASPHCVLAIRFELAPCHTGRSNLGWQAAESAVDLAGMWRCQCCYCHILPRACARAAAQTWPHEAVCKTVKGRRKKKDRRRGSGTAVPMGTEKELVNTAVTRESRQHAELNVHTMTTGYSRAGFDVPKVQVIASIKVLREVTQPPLRSVVSRATVVRECVGRQAGSAHEAVELEQQPPENALAMERVLAREHNSCGVLVTALLLAVRVVCTTNPRVTAVRIAVLRVSLQVVAT